MSAEITYGLERLAMYVQGVENVYDLKFNERFRYGEVFLQSEQEFSAYNFERADTEILFRHFADAEKECKALLEGEPALALPAYDQCLKASHTFNLLDARGVISVTERASYIGRVRTLAKACCEAWLASPKAPTRQAGVDGHVVRSSSSFPSFPPCGGRCPQRCEAARTWAEGGCLSAAPDVRNA